MEDTSVLDDIDTSLIGQYLGGEVSAGNMLFQRHRGRIDAVILKYGFRGPDVEDLSQTIFLKAFSSLSTFRCESAFTTWLTRIAMNCCCSRVKAISVENRKTEEFDLREEWDLSTHEPADMRLQRKEERGLVRELIADLPDHCRATMQLRHVSGKSYTDISETLGIPMGTVKVALHRGRHLLQKRVRRTRVFGGF